MKLVFGKKYLGGQIFGKKIFHFFFILYNLNGHASAMVNILHALPPDSTTLVAVSDDGFLKHELRKVGFSSHSIRENEPFYTKWAKLEEFKLDKLQQKVLLIDSVSFQPRTFLWKNQIIVEIRYKIESFGRK